MKQQPNIKSIQGIEPVLRESPRGRFQIFRRNFSEALGAAKGSQIQNVLVSLGYQNINDVKPEHYGALFAGVEALK